jgi:hypothetical protein
VQLGRRVVAVAGAGLLSVLAACSGGTDDAGAEPAGSAPPAPSQAVASAVAASPGATVASLPVLAGRRFEDAAGGDSFTLNLEVNEVRVVGRTTRLTFTVRNVGPAGSDNWTPGGIWASGHTSWDVSGVYLIDSVNAKRYLVARAGADEDCICTGSLLAADVNPGQGLLLTATYQALPPGVDTIDVSIPRVGVFTGVPVTR